MSIWAPRIASIENLISRDPGGRNIFTLVRRDHLQLAALSLVKARQVLLVSGFYIPEAGAGETDGPPGAKALGDALTALSIPVAYATDRRNCPLFEVLAAKPLYGWREDLLDVLDPSHLVAVERVGRAQDGRYYNMRGIDLNIGGKETEPLDTWFLGTQQRGIVTIGIGDGGNEVGMGTVFTQVLESIPHGPRIASVVPTDYLVVSGTSNWGAYGLTAAISIIAGRDLLPSSHKAAWQVNQVVAAGAVDGQTWRNENTVDSQPLSESLSLLEQLRQQMKSPVLFSPR